MPDQYPHEDDRDRDEEEFPDVQAEFRTGGSGIEYHCTEQELIEGGFADGMTVRDLNDMPEHDPEFAPPQVVGDPADYLEAPYGEHLRRPLQMLLDAVAGKDCTESHSPGRLQAILGTCGWPAVQLRAAS